MTRIDINDPRLTAYVLGELEGDEAAVIEQQIAVDEALGAAVNEIRQTASALSAEFAAEPALRLTDEQRQLLEQPPVRSLNNPSIFRARTLWTGAGLAAAACVGLVLTLPLVLDRAESDLVIAHGGDKLRQEEMEARKYGFDRDADLLKRADATVQLGMPLETDGRATVDSSLVGSKLDDLVSKGGLAGAGGGGGGGFGGGGGSGGGADGASSKAGMFVGEVNAPSASPPSGASAGVPLSEPEEAQVRARLQASATPRPPMSQPKGELGERPADERAAGKPAGVINDAFEGDLRFRENADNARDKEQFGIVSDNLFLRPLEYPLSTFSIDVDTASYSNMRQYLNNGQLPPPQTVRIEEMINYFDYAYEPPTEDMPFSANIEVNAAPWNAEHRLVRIGLKGKVVKTDMRPATNLVFLLDVSGSMNQANKLPLVKQSMKLLIEKLNADDRLAIVTYAGSAGLALDSQFCNDQNKQKIVQTIDALTAGGSTNGAGGIVMAYDVATRHFIKGGVNRVILCTDGDFNVGVSSDDELVRLIEDQRKTGVFLSVLGFGTGNFQDGKMEKLADHGNGMFAYIDQIEEGRKVLVDQMAGTLVTIAKDVKIQVEFNPAKVGAYRLIGYENRILAAEDFNDDRKDAGEIGAGHTVTALYEIAPPGALLAAADPPPVDELKYQKRTVQDAAAAVAAEKNEIIPNDELLTVKVRYKEPDGDQSKRLDFPVKDEGAMLDKASADFQFGSAVASFGMILRNSPHKGNATFPSVLDLAEAGINPENDKEGRRAEFRQMVEKARALAGQ